MCRIAAMRRPLRSKRAMISPVSPRANASGLTRINVRSIRRGRLAAGRHRAPAALGRAHDVRLAVGADRPARVERTSAAVAGVLQLAQAVRALEERALDVALAVRAGERLELRKPRLGRRELEPAPPHARPPSRR